MILSPIGLLCTSLRRLDRWRIQNSAGPLGMLLFFVGLGLFIVGKLRDRAAAQREWRTRNAWLSLQRNPHFECHTFTLGEAREFPNTKSARRFQTWQKGLRDNIVVPEKNTYEL